MKKIKEFFGKLDNVFDNYKEYLKNNRVYFAIMAFLLLLSSMSFLNGSVPAGLLFISFWVIATVAGIIDANNS